MNEQHRKNTETFEMLIKALDDAKNDQSDRQDPRAHLPGQDLKYDSSGRVFMAVDGSFQWFRDTPRCASACFVSMDSSLNCTREVFLGPSIFCAELDGVYMALETAIHSNFKGVHLIIDSEPALEVVQTLYRNDSGAVLESMLNDYSTISSLILGISKMVHKLDLEFTKVKSHTHETDLMSFMNARADQMCVGLLRDLYGQNA